jgi:hypothetical protein
MVPWLGFLARIIMTNPPVGILIMPLLPLKMMTSGIGSHWMKAGTII